jgi:hypothetical protein
MLSSVPLNCKLAQHTASYHDLLIIRNAQFRNIELQAFLAYCLQHDLLITCNAQFRNIELQAFLASCSYHDLLIICNPQLHDINSHRLAA